MSGDSFGARLKVIIKEAEITQKDLSVLVGKHKNTVSKWIRHEVVPSVNDVRLLAFHLDVDYNYLITGEQTIKYAVRRYRKGYFLASDKQKYVEEHPIEDLLNYVVELNEHDLKIVRDFVTRFFLNDQNK